MGRTTTEASIRTKNIDEILHIIASIVESNGYKQKIVDDETIWAKGDGVVMPMCCIGIIFSEGTVLVQGWIRGAIIGEEALNGAYAMLPKKKVKGMLEKIRKEILSRGI